MWRKVSETVCILLVCAAPALGADNYFSVATGLWHTAANWSLGNVPATNDHAYVSSGYLVTLTQDSPDVANVTIGATADKTSTFQIVAGTLNVTNELSFSTGAKSLGIGFQTGGSLSVTGNIYVSRAEGMGVYTQWGGSLKTIKNLYISGPGSRFFMGGTGTVSAAGCQLSGTSSFYQAGGTITITNGGVMSPSVGNTSDYTMVGGLLNVTSGNGLWVGDKGRGVFTQTGGTNSLLSYGLSLGHDSGGTGTGTYNFVGGKIIVVNHVYIGRSGAGTFNFGNATNTGVFVDNGTVDFQVGVNAGSRGTFQGWGAVALTCQVYMVGRVIADGYGQEHALDFSTMASAIVSARTNGVNNGYGWYAQNKGRLVLPRITLAAGSNNFWGDAVLASADPDLVNSVRITCSGATSGMMTGQLFAADSSNTHYGVLPHGVWQFDGGTFTGATLLFRYDESLESLSQTRWVDPSLKVFHYASGDWRDVTASVNTNTKTILTTSVTSLGQFAVGYLRAQGTIYVVH